MLFSALRRFNPLYNQFIVVGKKKDFYSCFPVGTKILLQAFGPWKTQGLILDIVKIPQESSRLASMMHDMVVEQLQDL